MKYIISWILSIIIFIICWIIVSKILMGYFQDPVYLMWCGVINYFISDKISGMALLSLTSSIPQEQEELN